MSVRITLAVVLCVALLGAGPSPIQAGDPAAPITPPAAQPPVRAAGPLVFRADGHLVTFLPGRACLVALDHALCVKFVDGTPTVPRPATGSGLPTAAHLDDGPLPLGEVRYEALWPGIDLVYSGTGGSIKATYEVAPGVDPAHIHLRYNLPAALQPDGSLRFEPPSGRGALTESAPVAWQVIGGQRVAVDAAFVVAADGQVGFSLGAYDRRYPLTIDPIYQWHTCYGSAGLDRGMNVALDGAGNIYVVGESEATWQGPGGEGPLHPYAGGSLSDIVVVKLDQDGGYLWHTFYGSSNWDHAYGVDVDTTGNVYITGYSADTWDGPGPASPLHGHGGGNADMVVLKLDSSGTYQWHTFYGSSSTGYDAGEAIGVDETGSVYVGGRSVNTWLGDGDTAPLHPYAGNWDVTVLKLDTDGAYQWHTFYGGGDLDAGYALTIDRMGGVYVGGLSGGTWQGDGNQDPLHPYMDGSRELVIVKLDASGAYQWHTFYGGGGSTLWTYMGMVTDGAGHVYLSGAYEVTWQGDGGAEPLHPHSDGPDDDIMVLKLDSNGTYRWHTFYGDSTSAGAGLAVDAAGNVYVAGASYESWQGDGDADPLHPAESEGYDAMVLKLNSSGTYQWHTFYGSYLFYDGGFGLALDGAGNIYVAGFSGNTWQGDGNAAPLHPHSGSQDLMVLKLAGDAQTSIDPVTGGTLVYTDTQGLTTTLQVPAGAVGACTDLVYTPLFSPTETLDPGDEYAHHAFLLHAYPCGGKWRVYLPLVVRGTASGVPAAGLGPEAAAMAPGGDPVFQEPALMAIHYSDDDVDGIDENTLRVVYWTGSAWEDMAGTCGAPPDYVRDADNNVIRFTFCHMSQGALVGN